MVWLLKLVTGNPLVLLWIVGGAFVAGLASGGGAAWKVQGWRLEALRGAYAERDTTAQAEATKAIQAAQTRARTAERKSAEDVAAVAAQFEKDKAHVALQNRKTIADLHTGILILRVQLDTRGTQPGDRSAASEIGSGTGQRDDCPGTVVLGQADSTFLIREASAADEIVEQLTACQAIVKADRAVGLR